MSLSTLPGLPDPRIHRLFDYGCVNNAIHTRSLEIKAELKPFTCAEKSLKDGHEVKLDEEGKVELDDAKKPVVSPLTDARAVELKALLAANATKIVQLKQEQTALSSARIRFSKNTSTRLRNVIDVIIYQLLELAFEKTFQEKKKFVTLEDLHTSGVAALPIFPLISSLESWKNPPVVKKSPAVAQDESEEPDTGADDDFAPVSLNHYIYEMTRALANPVSYDSTGKPEIIQVEKVNKLTQAKEFISVTKHDETAKYYKMRCRKDVKTYLNNIILEFLARISPIVQRQLQSMDVKTVTEQIIMDTIDHMLLDGAPVKESLEYEKIQIPNPAEVEKLRAEVNLAQKEKREATDKRKEDELPKIEGVRIKKTLKYDSASHEAFHKLLLQREAYYAKHETPSA